MPWHSLVSNSCYEESQQIQMFPGAGQTTADGPNRQSRDYKPPTDCGPEEIWASAAGSSEV